MKRDCPTLVGSAGYRPLMERLARGGERSWDVLLVGGASGTGKTTVAHQLARHFAVGISAVDDFQVILERLTTPEQQPALHFWRTHPHPESLAAEEIARHGFDVVRAMTPAIEAVIADHLDTKIPVVLEGDFISPALGVRPSNDEEQSIRRVRAIFLYEPDERHLLRNFSRREPDAGIQATRARVSWLQGQWLVGECARLGVPVLPSRPRHTLFTRILHSL